MENVIARRQNSWRNFARHPNILTDSDLDLRGMIKDLATTHDPGALCLVAGVNHALKMLPLIRLELGVGRASFLEPFECSYK